MGLTNSKPKNETHYWWIENKQIGINNYNCVKIEEIEKLIIYQYMDITLNNDIKIPNEVNYRFSILKFDCIESNKANIYLDNIHIGFIIKNDDKKINDMLIRNTNESNFQLEMSFFQYCATH